MQPVTIYTKSYCPYCHRAKQLLHELGVENFTEIDAEADPAAFEEVKRQTGRHTVPQIFIGQTHVGGFSDMDDLHRQGKLTALLNGG